MSETKFWEQDTSKLLPMEFEGVSDVNIAKHPCPKRHVILHPERFLQIFAALYSLPLVTSLDRQ